MPRDVTDEERQQADVIRATVLACSSWVEFEATLKLFDAAVIKGDMRTADAYERQCFELLGLNLAHRQRALMGVVKPPA